MPDRSPYHKVDVLLPARTLLRLAVFVALLTLVVISLDVLLSIFVAAALALGLDPVVGALVARG